jgi:hypothetical protein
LTLTLTVSIRGSTASAAAVLYASPRNIAVLGGTSAVSYTVLEQLRGYTRRSDPARRGDRYATAARVVQTFWTTTTPVVYLATGRNLPTRLPASRPPDATRHRCCSSSRPACQQPSSG